MSDQATSSEGRFINAPLASDDEYQRVPNEWVRDTAIIGNALSILLYVRSHHESFDLTLEYTRRHMGLGRDAFLRARRQLESGGYLEVIRRRHPAGARDPLTGKSIGGAVIGLDFVTRDPRERKKPAIPKPVDNVPKPNDGKPALGSKLSTGAAKMLVKPKDGKPAEGLPAAGNQASDYLHLKEDKLKEDKSSSSSSSSSDGVAIDEVQMTGVGTLPENEDDSGQLTMAVEPGLAKALREVHSRLDVSLLLSRLADHGIDPLVLNLVLAATEAIFASPRPVGDPVAYLVGAIRREPYRWIKQAGGSGNEHWGPVVLGCDAGVHLYGTPRSDPWQMVCLRCGEERDGWREQRDAAKSTGQAAS